MVGGRDSHTRLSVRLQDDDPRVTRRIRVLFRPSRRGQTRARRADPPEPPRPTAIAALDIVVAPLPDDVYDDRLILGGVLVQSAGPDRPADGLQAGDIILSYERVHDLVMGAFNHGRALAWSAGRTKHARTLKLKVLRGQHVVAVEVKR